MLARHFLIGLMALATLPVSHAPQEHSSQTLLAPAPLSDEITALSVREYRSGAGVLNRNQGRAMVHPAFR